MHSDSARAMISENLLVEGSKGVDSCHSEQLLPQDVVSLEDKGVVLLTT